MGHCTNNAADRGLGAYWEMQFCAMALLSGRSFSPLQLDHKGSAVAYQQANVYTLPDVTIWTHPGEHHEIKHKNPTRSGMFGLEVYRYNALKWFARETKQDVLYTIHNHDLAGGRDVKLNDIAHWWTVNILKLDHNWREQRWGYSWVGGQRKEVSIYYWSIGLWQPLQWYWR